MPMKSNPRNPPGLNKKKNKGTLGYRGHMLDADVIMP
jgi:hypothetical protein